MAVAKRVTFADWAGGEYGLLSGYDAPRNSFSGTNVVRYISGALGPRNGLNLFATSGLPAGKVLGVGYNFAADAAGQPAYIVVVGADLYLMAGGTFSLAGSFSAPPAEPPRFVEWGTLTYVSVVNDGLYLVNHGAGIMNNILAGQVGMRAFAQYGEFLVAGGPGLDSTGASNNADRLWYSEPNTPTSWPAANFIDVGSGAAINALLVQRNALVIPTASRWWVLNGVPGVNEVLREMSKAIPPGTRDHADVLGNGDIAYAIGSSSTGSVQSVGFFTGSEPQGIPHIFFGEGRGGDQPAFKVQPLKEVDDFLIMGGKGNAPSRMFSRRRGTITLHTFTPDGGGTTSGWIIGHPTADAWLVTDGGTDVDAAVWYQYRAYNDRPAFTADPTAQPGDATDVPFLALFATPEWYSEDGTNVAVASVVVDFRSWDTGSPSTNHFDVRPVALRTDDADENPAGTQSFDEAGAASAATFNGTWHRQRFDFSDSVFGNGFRIEFTNLRGVAIEKVQVHLRADEARF